MPVWLSYPSRQTRRRGVPPPPPPTADTKHCLIYFVPGNPGFIDYYEPFLSTMRARLDEVEDKKRKDSGDDLRFHILGRNLIGFEDGDDGGGSYGPGPYDLDMQILAVWDSVANARIDLGKAGGPRHGTPFDEVVLMGHSVGSYIALDVFRRQQAAHPEGPSISKGQASAIEPVGSTSHLNLRLGVLLFATLTHLAQSPRGQKLERMLLTTPVVSPWADVLAQAVVWWLLPVWLLAAVVRFVLRFPPHAAAVTLRFLASRGGVRQALFLGRDELRNIGPDEWEDELWEVASAGYANEKNSKHQRPKFVILFGEDDHWVANDVRDDFIARRNAHAASRAQILLDERGWPHDFCIRHGEEVAETVTVWLKDLAESL
ncbi:hypothetical protein Sste5346_003575 [Sporothrix stenoceras]|uniref:Lipid droplet-associated hydrolase n=1 Tax=Sporothrix stenoceras TaxID=5173 RepID=A0ABR3ZCU3_9PEZI